MTTNLPELQLLRQIKTSLYETDTVKIILNSLSEGVLVADRNGKLLVFNPAAERILGIGYRDVSPDEWASVYGCYREDQRTPYPSNELPLARALLGEEVNENVIFIQNPRQPKGIWISASASPIKEKDGTIIGGTVIFRDITEQRFAMEQINVFREKYRHLFMAVEQTADSILITDTQGIIQYVNAGFEATTGYTRQEAIGQTPRILKSGHHDQTFYKNLWDHIQRGEHFRGTFLNQKKNGELWWAEQTITPLKDETGHITNFVSVLKDITELRKKQEQDIQLEIARKVQQNLFPAAISVPGFDIVGMACPAEETGGDYYDYIPTSNGSVWIVIGDVSGHGIGAALVMATVRAYLRVMVKTESDPGEILTKINQELVLAGDDQQFVTMLLARIDPKQRQFVYGNAGHIPGYHLSPSGEILTKMTNESVPLGIFKDTRYTSCRPTPFAPGDILVFITDGIMEATSPDNTQYGLSRALEIVHEHQADSSQQIVDELYQSVRTFCANQPQDDDITAIVCKVKQTE